MVSIMPLEQGWSPVTPAFSSPTSSSSSPGRTESHDADPHDGRPQTPEQQTSHAFTSPISSPTLPSPMNMSLYNLGIGFSPLSPLRRQFTSPLGKGSPSPAMANADADDELSDATENDNGIYENDGSSDEDADLTQDSKDVLMDRINDLLHRLAIGGSLKGENISSLHAKVDEMEKVLASDHGKPVRPRSIRRTPSLMQLASPLPVIRRDSIADGADERHQERSYWGLPVTPNKPLAHRFSEPSGPTTAIKDPFIEQQHVNGYPLGEGLQRNDESQQDGEPQLDDELYQDGEHLDEQQVDATDHEEVQIPSTVAEQVVHEAEKLCAELNTVLRNLQDRREESDHLHAMLIDRAENAARRILELDELVTTLEDELDSNRSDLDHLRLQLRAVEVLCYEYVPPHADRDLLQSIENWKMDYSKIKVEMATRRRERISGESVLSPTSVLSPSTSLLIERAGLYN